MRNLVIAWCNQLNLSLKDDATVRRIFKNAATVLSGNTASSGFGVISFAILANQLGAELLGLLVLAQTYNLIVNDLINIQTWEAMIKYCSHDTNDDEFSGIVLSNVVIDVASAVVAFAAAFFLVGFAVDALEWDKSLANLGRLYSLSLLTNITSLTIGVPRLFNQFKQVSIVQASVAALKLAFISIAAVLSAEFIVFVCIYLAAEILINVTLITLSVRTLNTETAGDWWRQKLRFHHEQIRFIWWLNLRTIVRIPVRHFDMIVISTVISLETVGIYKVYREIASLLSKIQDPVNQTIYPEFTKLLARGDRHETARIALKTMSILSAVSFVLIGGLLMTSYYIVETVFGASYLEDINALHALVIAYLLSFVTVPVNSLFIASGFAKTTFHVLLVTNSLYLLSAYYFAGIYGIYGIVIAYTVQVVLNRGLKIYLLRMSFDDWGSGIR